MKSVFMVAALSLSALSLQAKALTPTEDILCKGFRREATDNYINHGATTLTVEKALEYIQASRQRGEGGCVAIQNEKRYLVFTPVGKKRAVYEFAAISGLKDAIMCKDFSLLETDKYFIYPTQVITFANALDLIQQSRESKQPACLGLQGQSTYLVLGEVFQVQITGIPNLE